MAKPFSLRLYAIASEAKALGDELTRVQVGLNKAHYDQMTLAQLVLSLKYIREVVERRDKAWKDLYRVQPMRRALEELDSSIRRFSLEADLAASREAELDLTPAEEPPGAGENDSSN